MPAPARATLGDVWACEMPALPQFGTDVKLSVPQQVSCPRCGATGRVELQESWGTLVYPFSTTFACHDKVGVQCQTRVARASDGVAVAGVPAFVADFVAAHALEKPSPERSLVVEAPRIPARWIEAMPTGALKRECEAMHAASAQDLRSAERIAEQRLSIHWTGVAEVLYRYEGKAYRVWVPDREDATPIALDHPVIATEPANVEQPPVAPAPVSEPVQVSSSESPSVPAHVQSAVLARRVGGALGWVKSFVLWLAIFGVVSAVAAWIVNWKP